jgi:hypothetical protein
MAPCAGPPPSAHLQPRPRLEQQPAEHALLLQRRELEAARAQLRRGAGRKAAAVGGRDGLALQLQQRPQLLAALRAGRGRGDGGHLLLQHVQRPAAVGGFAGVKTAAIENLGWTAAVMVAISSFSMSSALRWLGFFWTGLKWQPSDMLLGRSVMVATSSSSTACPAPSGKAFLRGVRQLRLLLIKT